MITLLMRRYVTRRMAMMSLCVAGAFAMWPAAGPIALVPVILSLWRVYPKRAVLFELALPIHARDIFLARLLSSTAIILFPLFAWIVSAQVQQTHMLSLTTMLDIVALVTLSLIIPHAVRASEFEAPRIVAVLLPWISVATMGTLVIYALPPVVGVVICCAAIPLAFLFTWLSIPEAFQTAPARAAPAASERTWRTFTLPTFRAGSAWWMPIGRSVVGPNYLLFLFLLLVSAAIGQFLTMLCLAIISTHEALRQRTRWLLALPLSNRTRLLIVLLPGAVGFAFCIMMVRSLYLPFNGLQRGPDHYSPSSPYPKGAYFSSRTRAGLEYWNRTTGEHVPVIAAPWGETTPADTISVYGLALFNPYTSGAASSERFVAWQYARLTTAVYGHPLALTEFDGSRTWPPSLTDAPRMEILNAAALLTLVLVLVLLIELARGTRQRAGRRFMLAMAFVPTFPVFAIILADVRYSKRGTQVLIPMVERFLLHMSAMLPANPVAFVALAAAPVACVYALLEWRFGRGEMPPAITLNGKLVT